MSTLRGFNIASTSESALLALAMTGCKVARLEIKQGIAADIVTAQSIALQCAKFGMGLIIYCTVGDQATLPDWWLDRAEQWRSAPGFIGFDIANELTIDPVSHQTLMQRCIDRIRLVDKDRLIVVQGVNGSIPDTWDQFLPPKGDNLLFSPHMYYDMFTTHQGVYPRFPAPVSYPSDKCNPALFRVVLNKVKASGLPIVIGEFSCARWTPGNGSYQWVRDCLDIFEEMGFGWLYECWRAYQGWDCELPEGIAQEDALDTNPWPTRVETDTLRLLKLRMLPMPSVS